MKKENLKKEVVKAILYVCLLITGSLLALMITNNGLIIFTLGMSLGGIFNILEKWIDEKEN